MNTDARSAVQRSPRLRFGPFEIDLQEHELRRDGAPLALTRKAFALLVALLGRPGKLVSKTELFETVWAGTVVSDAALSRAIRELRVALGDDAAAPRYIATVHGLGFRFVAVVATDGFAPAPPLPEPTPVHRLVGRDLELALLDTVLSDVRAGQRRIVFVTGEAGVGKTALVDACLERQATHADLRTGQGRCIEQYGTSEAYLPMLEALEGLARQTGADVLRGVLARYAPAWLVQLPWLAHDADPALLHRNGAITTHGMLREIAQALEVLAAQQPIVLWLEDLHWSDPSSLAVISFLAGRRGPARLLVIASFRPGDAHAAETPLRGLVAQLRQRDQASEIALDRLDADAVAAYLGRRFGGARAELLDRLATFVRRRTEGNALFTVAMVDDLVRRQLVEYSEGEWMLRTPLERLGDLLPDSLRRLVHDQLDRLHDDDRRLVEAAAVVGVDFSAAALAAALQSDVASIEDRCLRLAEQGRLLRGRFAASWPDGTVASGFGFLHALYWQGTVERVPQGRRAEWQRRIGLAQERAYGAQSGLIAVELAMRFEAAHDPERAVRYLREAGAAALARAAYVECTKLLRHALALVPRLPLDQRDAQELDVLLPLGAALMAAQGYASTEVETTYQRALVLAESGARPVDPERALRGLWNVAFLRADLARARTMAERLLAQAESAQNEALVADAHAKLGQTCVHLGDLASAGFYLERSLSASLAAGDPARLREAPRVAIFLAWVHWYRGQPDRALRQADEALAIAERAGSPHSMAFATGYASQLHYLCGDVARDRANALQLRALSAEHGLAFWRQLADFSLGAVRVHDGDAIGGVESMQRAIDEIRADGGLVGVPYLLCRLAEAELAGNRVGAASASLAEGTRLIAATANALHAAEAARLAGQVALAGRDAARRQTAEGHFESALAVARRQGSRSLELRAATSLAQLRIEAGDADRALDVLAPIHATFDEGFDTADLRRAAELMATLRRSR
ncbi:MAG: AAA family ATPase [Caldimonas sp.]